MIKYCLIAIASLVALSLPASAQKITWKSVFTPDFSEISDATYGMSKYVAVGKDGAVLYSSNGQNWSKGKLPEGISCDLNTVEFAFDQFWAGGENLDTNKGVILLSLDGVNWADVTEDYDLGSQWWDNSQPKAINQFFCFKNAGKETLFVSMLDYTDKNEIRYTKEGAEFIDGYLSGVNIFQNSEGLGWLYNPYGDNRWEFATNLTSGISSNQNSSFPADLTKMAYGNSFYVGVGPKRKIGYWNGVKDDDYSYGNQFTYATSPAISDYNGVAFGGGCFVAVGTNGAVVESFDNGKSWAVVKLNLGTINLNGIKFVGNKFIAFGGGRIITGDPAKQRSWSAATLPSRPANISSIATDGKIAVAVGYKGQILYSTTGKSWSKAPPSTSNDLYAADYDSTTKSFYVTGANGSLLRSSNGINWTVVKTNTTNFLWGVARAGSKLVAAGAAGSFLSSKDGKSWSTTTSSSLNSDIRAVSFGGSAGFIQIYSKEGQANGQVWMNNDGGSKVTKLKKPDSTNFGDAQVFNGSVYLAGENGNLYSSPQKTVGGSWKKITTRTTNYISGLSVNANSLTAVGSEGLVFTLQKDNKWRSESIFEGTPWLNDAIYFNKLWIVAGQRNNAGFIATTSQD